MIKAKYLKKFLDSLPAEALEFPVYFDTQPLRLGYYAVPVGDYVLLEDYILLKELTVSARDNMEIWK
jgi:hypothetical protein